METTLRHRDGTGRNGSGADDHGFTLVEVVISMAIAGMALLIIMGGLTVAIRQSHRGLTTARFEGVLAGAADHVTAAPYVPCPESDTDETYLHSAQAAAVENGLPASAVSILDIDYWNPVRGGSDKWVEANTLTGASCNPAVLLTPSRGLQRLTIQVRDAATGASRSIEVVKSDVA